jgi:hypothetical protein
MRRLFDRTDCIAPSHSLATAPEKLSLCCYLNMTHNIQKVRITNIPAWHFERTVFPGQNLVFQAPAEAQLEVHPSLLEQGLHSEYIPCDRLVVKAPNPACLLSTGPA